MAGVMDLIAATANTAAAAEAEAPDTDETEAGGEPVENDAETDDLVDAAPKEEGEEETEEEPKPSEEEADRLRQADYTKKTQALAEERKKLHAEMDELKAKQAAKDEDIEEVSAWLKGLNDPEQAEYQLQRFFPQMLEQLKAKWIAEAGEESQLSERERAMRTRMRQLEVERRARAEDDEKVQRKAKAQETADLRQKFNAWLPKAALAAGLTADEDTIRLIRNEMISGAYNGAQWTENVFVTAAKAVAKAIKKGEAPPAEQAKAKAKAPPPSLKGTGHKAPPGGPKVKAAKGPVDSENYFKNLRAKYGK